MEFFNVVFIKNLKENVQQGHPREVKGDKGREKIIKCLSYEVICILLGTKKCRKETRLGELRDDFGVRKQGLWHFF